MKEGFKGQRLITLPEDILKEYSKHPLIKTLYIRKIGHFPKVKHHNVVKPKGCDYYMLIYCVAGKGWYKINNKTYIIEKDHFIFLPSDTPYSFGANEEEPWTIYWIHFRGTLAKEIINNIYTPKEIRISNKSRFQERLDLFEEIYYNFSLSYIKEYMIYSSICLFYFLASFIYITQFRNKYMINHKEDIFIQKVNHFMKENIYNNLKLNDIAQYFNYSTSHFIFLFKKEFQESPISYFLKLKVQKACEYLELTNLKIIEISNCLGFEDPAYFSRLFKKIMGISPQKYRINELSKYNEE